MAAVGCRVNAIFDRGSNLCPFEDQKMTKNEQKNSPLVGSNHQKLLRRRELYLWTTDITEIGVLR